MLEEEQELVAQLKVPLFVKKNPAEPGLEMT